MQVLISLHKKFQSKELILLCMDYDVALRLENV